MRCVIFVGYYNELTVLSICNHGHLSGVFMKKIFTAISVFLISALPEFASAETILPKNWGYDLMLVDGEMQNTLRQFHTELLVIITIITLNYLCIPIFNI